jgi:hypothetical protein
MSIQDLEARLAAMDDEFRRAPSESSLYEPPPDGTYQALVDSWDHFEALESGRAFLKCVFQVQNHPDYGGRYAETIFSLEDPGRLTFLKQFIRRLGGMTQDEVDALSMTAFAPNSGLLRALLDTPVEIKVVRKGSNPKDAGRPYVNTYLQHRLGDPVSRSDVTSNADIEAFDVEKSRDARYGATLPDF